MAPLDFGPNFLRSQVADIAEWFSTGSVIESNGDFSLMIEIY